THHWSHRSCPVRQYWHQGALQQSWKRLVEVPPTREQGWQMDFRLLRPHLLGTRLDRRSIGASDQLLDCARWCWMHPAIHLYFPALYDDGLQGPAGRHLARRDLRSSNRTSPARRQRRQAMDSGLQEGTLVEPVRSDLLPWVLRHLHIGLVRCFHYHGGRVQELAQLVGLALRVSH
ncbi:hypothetical protein LTR40_014441, partial [Exophiala xenobiotica]